MVPCLGAGRFKTAAAKTLETAVMVALWLLAHSVREDEQSYTTGAYAYVTCMTRATRCSGTHVGLSLQCNRTPLALPS